MAKARTDPNGLSVDRRLPSFANRRVDPATCPVARIVLKDQKETSP